MGLKAPRVLNDWMKWYMHLYLIKSYISLSFVKWHLEKLLIMHISSFYVIQILFCIHLVSKNSQKQCLLIFWEKSDKIENCISWCLPYTPSVKQLANFKAMLCPSWLISPKNSSLAQKFVWFLTIWSCNDNY